jgi:hypothetical protein
MKNNLKTFNKLFVKNSNNSNNLDTLLTIDEGNGGSKQVDGLFGGC